MRRLVSAVAALAAAAVVVLGPAAAAHADPPLITSLNCDSADNRVNCSMTYQAEGSVTIKWSPIFHPEAFVIYDFTNQTSISFECHPRYSSTIRVTVTDTLGNYAENGVEVACVGVYPLRITDFDCDTGDSLFFCAVQYAGGKHPITIRWIVNNAFQPQFDDDPVIRIGCRPGRYMSIGVKVKDARGREVEDGTGCTCSLNQQ